MTSEEICQLLPEVFQRAAVEGSPLAALTEAMQALHEPTDAALSSLAQALNPFTAPDRFVPFLARWVDMGWLLRTPGTGGEEGPLELVPGLSMARLRLLIAHATALSQGRGTHHGLVTFLRLAVGLEGIEIQDWAPPGREAAAPFHLVVAAPAEARPMAGLIHTIMTFEKPAYATYELQFAGDGSETGEG